MCHVALHRRLIARQSDEELERKARKAVTRSNIWTQEELDAADREAKRMAEFFDGNDNFTGTAK